MSVRIEVKPLCLGQQQFLQQILALQVVSDSKCKKIYDQILDMCSDDEDTLNNMGHSMENCIGKINASLEPGFGMEIRTVELPEIGPDQSLQKKRYHSVVNKLSDDIAKNWGAHTKTPHEIAFLKLILQRIVESEYSQDEEEDPFEDKQKKRGMGSSGRMHKIDLINLRNELDDVHKQKISLHQAEKALAAFCREGWLVSETQSGDNDRGSRSMLKVGPRTYMELPDFMEKILPMGVESLPQFILHRQ